MLLINKHFNVKMFIKCLSIVFRLSYFFYFSMTILLPSKSSCSTTFAPGVNNGNYYLLIYLLFSYKSIPHDLHSICYGLCIEIILHQGMIIHLHVKNPHLEKFLCTVMNSEDARKNSPLKYF